MEYENLEKVPAVYKIICIVSGKIYIGSTVSLRYRISRHINELNKQNHHSKYLQNAFNKYGIDSFEVSILEKFEKDKIYRKKILKIEQYYLDKLKPYDRKIGYNTCHIAGAPAQRRLSKEQKEKISKSLKGRKVSKETKEKIGNANRGKKCRKKL